MVHSAHHASMQMTSQPKKTVMPHNIRPTIQATDGNASHSGALAAVS